ncbi:MAG: hypothetical protein IPO09_08650 [Anaeromyxobacter sp.]|nr:hypothetical protein [Anaeromyxobacter sp.]MBL0277689.1 hypothetical protein [Anaeromyxobacter sp.]
MGRLIALVTACTLLTLAPPAGAAELTRVPSSGEPDNAFDLDLSVRWERSQKRSAIKREYAAAASPGEPFGTVTELPQLRYAEITNTLVTRLAVGLWQDLGLHAELPYVLGHEVSWRAAPGVGVDVVDTIAGNVLDPDGAPCAGAGCTRPLFPVDAGTTVYHGGATGDLVVGLAWGIFSDRRDDTKPAWVVGLDVTFPTARRFDPIEGRTQSWLLPYVVPSEVGPVGQKVWRYDLHTTLSRRMGALDPYLRAHVTALRRSSGTYSNCEHAAQLAAPGASATGPQMASDAAALCAADPSRWGARLPYLAGLTFGAELVPYEDAAAGQKIAFDLRVTGDYTSSARWYNELTDATGKLHATEDYLTVSARLGLLFRASEHVMIQGAASMGYVTPHLLTGESLAGQAENPNFDWRYDAPARRFRLTEATVFDLQVAGVLQF